MWWTSSSEAAFTLGWAFSGMTTKLAALPFSTSVTAPEVNEKKTAVSRKTAFVRIFGPGSLDLPRGFFLRVPTAKDVERNIFVLFLF